MASNTTNPDEDAAREQRRAARLAQLHADLAASDGTGTDRPADERPERFSGPPLGYNEDGTPQQGLSEARRQHKRDILAGRKQPGDPVEDPAD